MRCLRAWMVRLAGLFRAARRSEEQEQELAAELESHLQMHIEDNLRAGMTLEQARRDARIKLGGVEQTKQACRERNTFPWMENLLRDVRYALRGFRRAPLFTATVVATLALGIGATTAVFSVVDPILFRSLPYAHANRLVSVGLVQSLEPREFTLGAFYFDWQENQKPFESLTAEGVFVHLCDLTELNPAHLSCATVQQNFLPTLGISPVVGRNFLPEEDRPNGPKVALVSYGLWLSHYNRDPGIVNKLIDLDGSQVRVVGVLPQNFEMPTLEPADVLLPMVLDPAIQHKVNGGLGYAMRSFARLKPGVTIAQALAEMQPLYQSALSIVPLNMRNEFLKDFRIRVRSLRDRQMQDVSRMAWVLLVAAFAVLLIACANVASLLMARGAARGRELAVRSALGASRGRVVRQGMTEALILAAAGAIAGCVLADILLRCFIAMAPVSLPFLSKARLDFRIILFTIGISLCCAVLFGIIPALQKPRSEALVARTTNSSSHAHMRQGLVVVQISLSVILLSSAGLLLRSFWNLQRQNLGMQTRSILTINIPLASQQYNTGQKCMDFFLKVESALRRLPGITTVGLSDSLPPAGWTTAIRYSEMSVAGKPRPPAGSGGTVVSRWVTPDYFRALEIPILQGRGFTEAERTSPDHPIIISRLLAERMFPGENPIGQSIAFKPNDPLYTVVGVAANVKNGGLAGQENPEYYQLRANVAGDWSLHSVIVVKTSLPSAAVIPWVRSQISLIDPTAPVEIETLTQRVSILADGPRFTASLLGFFAFTGLLLATIGLYGVTSFVVTQRTQEIGIRMALGAQRGRILRMVMQDAGRLIGLGLFLGLAVSLAGARMMQALLFKIAPRDPVTLGAICGVMLLAGLFAAWWPARRAASIDPMQALRAE